MTRRLGFMAIFAVTVSALIMPTASIGSEDISIKVFRKHRKGNRSLNSNIIISVIVRESENNRKIRLECSSENFDRISEEEIISDEHGSNEKYFKEIRFELYLDPGEYFCRAILTRKSDNGNGDDDNRVCETKIIISK